MICEEASSFQFLRATLIFPWLLKLARRSRIKPDMRFKASLIDENRYAIVEGQDEGEFYDVRWLWSDISYMWEKLDHDFNLYPDDSDATYSVITDGHHDP